MRGRGFWLNTANSKWVEVDRHEISLKNKADQKKLGLSKEQQMILDLTKGDEDVIRMHGVKMGLIRIRDYQDGVHVQFYTERSNVRKYLEELSFLINISKTGLKQAWNISIENMHPTAKDFASLPMSEFLDAIDSGRTVMKESKRRA